MREVRNNELRDINKERDELKTREHYQPFIDKHRRCLTLCG